MNTALTLSWRNLWRHRRRTWLTIGAMVFSNVLLVFMITLQFGSYDMMIDSTLKAYSGQIQISADSYHEQPKMRTAMAGIEALSTRVRAQFPDLSVSMRGETFVLASSDERSFGLQLAGVDVQHEVEISTIPGQVNEGRYLQPGNQNEIIIGKVLARNLQVSIGDEITLLGSGFDASFAAAIVTVVGIFESGIRDLDRSLAQISYADFQDLFAMQGRGHSIVISTPDVSKVDDYRQDLLDWLAVSGQVNELEVLGWKQLFPGLQEAIQTDMISAWLMYGVLIILVAFSVLNTQLMSVLERTREFGIMTAIGLRPGTLGKLVLLETSVMAALGFVIGILAGLVVALYFNKFGLSYPGMEEMMARYNLPGAMYPSIKPVSVLLGPGAVFIGCLLAAIYPAAKLRLLQPVEAMRAV